MSERFVVISGCSGGGKSTLLAELERQGHGVVAEPGRRIVADQLRSGGSALPWVDGIAFARNAIQIALADRAAAADAQDWVFFDRGLVDAASTLQHLTGDPALEAYGREHRYHHRVFLTPPWPEIYVTDAERRHDLQAALPEYERLLRDYPSLGYEVIVIPKIDLCARADFILAALSD